MIVVSLFLILNFSIGVSASINYDRQEADTCITISERLSVKTSYGKSSENLVNGGSDTRINGTSYNAKKLKQTQPYVYDNEVDQLVELIKEKGPNAVPPIQVRVHDGVAYIVDGHHRYNAFVKLGYERVPIKYLHSSDLGKILFDGTYIRSLDEILDGASLVGD